MTPETVPLSGPVMLAIIALGFGPGLFWLWYFQQKDLEPEPRHMIRNCFLLGMVAVIPAALLEQLFRTWETVDAVIVAPVVEESLKFLVCFLVIWRNENFDEPMDGVIYAVSVALGFASLENCFYLVAAYRESAADLGVVTILRAFFAVPSHALYAVMWGYGLGRAKFSQREVGKPLIAAGLGLAMAVHAAYNLLASFGAIWAFGMIVFIPVVWGLAHRRIDHALQSSPHHRTREDFKLRFNTLKNRVTAKMGPADWYENRLTVVLLLFLVCFPAGFYALYRNSTLSRPEKASYVVLWLLMFAFIGTGG
jgi:RsiW-degrading membrane proteinase PrsW (M82 family)